TPLLSRPSALTPIEPGGGIEVLYDPSNPSRTVLEPGAQRSALLFAGVGALLLILSAVPLGSGRKRGIGARSLRAEGLIPSTFEPSDPDEEKGWSKREDLDRSKRSFFG